MLAEVLEDGDSFVVAHGGRGGKGNTWFATSVHRSPREWQPGEDGEARHARARAQAHRRRRTRRPAERRQVHAALRHQRRHAQDRRLPVHDARAEPRRRAAERQPHLRRRGHSRHHRGRARGEGARPAVPAAHRAHAPARVPHPHRRARLAGGVRSAPQRDRAVLARSWPRSRTASSSPRWTCSARTKPPPIEAPDAFGVFAISAAGAHRSRRAEARVVATPARHAQGRRAAGEGRRASLTWSCIRDDPRYPAALRDLPDPPRTLWARGDLALLDRPCVAIVGTRRATAYAERVTRELARALARAGACVVSGLARGVDAAAHRAALDADGATCAVLGTGLDVAYPRGARGAPGATSAMRGLLLVRARSVATRRTAAPSRGATASSPRSRASRSSSRPA